MPVKIPAHLLVVFGACAAFANAAIAQTPLERGRYLMNSIVACGNCHTPQTPSGPQAGRELAGGTPFVEGFGKSFASNITPDLESGIGHWSDEQLITAIREGKRPDGSVIGPPMPIELYRGLTDGDVRAIVSYIRSLPPVRNVVPKSEYKIRLPASYGPPVPSVPEVSRQDQVAYGAYLAGPAGHCIECHSTPGPQGAPDIHGSLGAGGMSFTGPWGTSVARNITPTNLASWSDAEISRAITEGIRPDGTRLMPPMAYGYYKNIASEDLRAIIAYLRTLPPK